MPAAARGLHSSLAPITSARLAPSLDLKDSVHDSHIGLVCALRCLPWGLLYILEQVGK